MQHRVSIVIGLTVFEFLYGSHICECFDFVITLTHYTVLPVRVYQVVAIIYHVRSSHIVSSTNRTEIEIKLRLICRYTYIPLQQAAAAYTCKTGRDLVRVAVYQSITMRRRMIRVAELLIVYGL